MIGFKTVHKVALVMMFGLEVTGRGVRPISEPCLILTSARATQVSNDVPDSLPACRYPVALCLGRVSIRACRKV